MKIGFTGTQEGMSERQKDAIEVLLKELRGEFHHGDCIGADAEFHSLALGLHIVVHPPKDQKKRAFCHGGEVRPAKEYLVRNRDIVNETDLLIAAPKSLVEENRSGTWFTVRYARKQNKPVIVLDR